MVLRGRSAWMWECAEHPRHRGYHHDHRLKDHVLARAGKPPDTPPFERAIAGALEHWGRYHMTAEQVFKKIETEYGDALRRLGAT